MKNTTKVLRFAILLLVLLSGNIKLSKAQSTYNLPESYGFKLGVTYDVSSGKTKAEKMTLWFSENGYSGAELAGNSAMFMVFDLKSMKMVTLMEAQKMAMVMDLDKMEKLMPSQEKESNFKIEKTGIKEAIAGYSCEQYKISSDKSSTLAWITTELGSAYGEYAKNLAMLANGGMGKQGKGSMPEMKDLPDGVMLKMESTDLKSKDKSTLVATSVNKTPKTVTTSGLKVMSMPGE